MGDANAVLGQVATEENVALATDIASQSLNFSLKMFTDAWGLVQENFLFLVVIAVLTKAVDAWVLDNYTPIPGGWLRYLAAFLIVMFFAWVWVGFVRGFI